MSDKKIVSLMIILCCSALVQSISASVGKSLVAHWPFDEGTGTSLEDASGNGHDGDIKGEVKWIDGPFGKALEFDGETGLATIATSAKLNFGDDFSVLLWVRTNQVRAKNADWWMGGWIINKDMGGQQDTTDWAVANVDGKLAFVTGNKETDKDDIVASTKAISDGKWHHIALTRVRKSGVNTIYFDGVKDASLVKGLGLPVSNDVVMTIGGHPAGAAHAFAGAVDDMAIFTKVLSADEINLAIKSGINRSSTAVKRNGKLTIMWGQLRTNL